jgi:hypothetical protein
MKLLVTTWQIVPSLPPRLQLATAPFVWSRLSPSSNVGFTQKLLGKSAAWTQEAPSKRNANPARRQKRVKEAGGIPGASDGLLLPNKSSGILTAQFAAEHFFDGFMIFMLSALVRVRLCRRRSDQGRLSTVESGFALLIPEHRE